MAHWMEFDPQNMRIAELEVAQGWYLPLEELLHLMPSEVYERILFEHKGMMKVAAGSSHNHQAWEGGYLDHITEVMNIACQQFNWMSRVRKLPFRLAEALEVLFLHDIEKPWKYAPVPGGIYPGDVTSLDFRSLPFKTKEDRVNFREAVIAHYKIELTEDQKNALKYVEGVRDTDYTPGERTMNELAAFCHTCDLLSARMWHDKGKDVPHASDRWE